jgi:hypothetical protein
MPKPEQAYPAAASAPPWIQSEKRVKSGLQEPFPFAAAQGMLSARRADNGHPHHLNHKRMQTLSGGAADAMEAIQQVWSESGTGDFARDKSVNLHPREGRGRLQPGPARPECRILIR